MLSLFRLMSLFSWLLFVDVLTCNSQQEITMIKLQVYQYDACLLVAIFQVVHRGVKSKNPQILQSFNIRPLTIQYMVLTTSKD